MATTLPSYVKVLAEGYTQDRAAAVSRTPFEDGMVKQLQTASRVLVGRTVTLGFATFADYQTFITYYQTTLHYGADWFSFTDYLDGVTRLARFVSKLGNEQPLFGINQWRVGATIETWSDA